MFSDPNDLRQWNAGAGIAATQQVTEEPVPSKESDVTRTRNDGQASPMCNPRDENSARPGIAGFLGIIVSHCATREDPLVGPPFDRGISQ